MVDLFLRLQVNLFWATLFFKLSNDHAWVILFSWQASRDYVVGQIMLACTEIIKIVEAREDLDQRVDQPGYMAATLKKVTQQNQIK